MASANLDEALVTVEHPYGPFEVPLRTWMSSGVRRQIR